MLIRRRFAVVLLMVIVLISGCSSASPSPSASLVSTDGVTSAPPASPATSPAATAPSGEAPEPGVADGDANGEGDPPGLDEPNPLVNTVVVTVSDGLRVRSQPRISADSEKYEPLLPVGTELFVFDGPVSGSGYNWYEVAPVSIGLVAPGTCGSPKGPCEGLYTGWVAAAGRDGEPWLAVSAADCPPVPADVPALTRLPLGARLACFSGRPIVVQARLIECNCDVDGGGYEPGWFGWGSQPLLLVEPSETYPPPDSADWLIVMLDPAGRHPDVLSVGEIVEVTGMFDHPAALDCLFQGIPIETAGPPAPTSDCRFMFATTSLVALQP